MTRDELLALPTVVDLTTAARALSIGRTRAFELVRRGEFPVPVLRVGTTYRVPTAPLLNFLGLVDQETRWPAVCCFVTLRNGSPGTQEPDTPKV